MGALAQKPPEQLSPLQHGEDVEHDWPELRQTGPLEQMPPLHDRPEQHCVDELHESPDGRHVVG